MNSDILWIILVLSAAILLITVGSILLFWSEPIQPKPDNWPKIQFKECDKCPYRQKYPTAPVTSVTCTTQRKTTVRWMERSMSAAWSTLRGIRSE